MTGGGDGMTIANGTLWQDRAGNPVHCHGGGIIREGPYYYWFGENRQGKTRVSCYRSANLTDWEYRGDVLTLDSPFRPIDVRTDPRLITDDETGTGANIERPKVVKNPLTGKYVMWMHWENGKDYSAARCAVASCDTIDGPYTYHGSFNPAGHMSRDCTLFVDDDGTAYFISAARDNADLHIYRLSDDYLSIDEHVKTLWPGQYREAPAMFKRNGVYFLVTSGCTGWEPNQGKYAYAEQITGRWSKLFNFGGPTTFDTQPAYILPIQSGDQTDYLYLGDRWDPSDYHRSSYALLPLKFPDDRTLAMEWADFVKIGPGSVETWNDSAACALWRIRTRSHRYLTAYPGGEAGLTAARLSYSVRSQLWKLEPGNGEGYVRIRNAACGRFLQPSPDGGAKAVLAERSGSDDQDWRLEEDEDGMFIISRLTGQALTVSGTPGNPRGIEISLAGRLEKHGQHFLIVNHYGAAQTG